MTWNEFVNQAVGYAFGLLYLLWTGIAAISEGVLVAVGIFAALYFVSKLIGTVVDQVGHVRATLDEIAESLNKQTRILNNIRRELDGSAARGRAEVAEFAHSVLDQMSDAKDEPPSPDPLGRSTPPS